MCKTLLLGSPSQEKVFPKMYNVCRRDHAQNNLSQCNIYTVALSEIVSHVFLFPFWSNRRIRHMLCPIRFADGSMIVTF